MPAPRASRRTRVLIWLAWRFDTTLVLPSIASLERVKSHAYRQAGDGESVTMVADERSHARLLNEMRRGVAGLLAGSFSMALGEWLSIQSSWELYPHQIRTEKRELAEWPEEAAAELALTYQAKGLDEAQAQRLAGHIMSDDKEALATLAREELRVEPGELGGSPWEAALMSFLLCAVGAIIPVLPFMFLMGYVPDRTYRGGCEDRHQRVGFLCHRRGGDALHRPYRIRSGSAPGGLRSRYSRRDLRHRPGFGRQLRRVAHRRDGRPPPRVG